MLKNAWTQSTWLWPLGQAKGTAVSLCFQDLFWVSSVRLWAAVGSAQILLFLLRFFPMLYKSTTSAYTKERTHGGDNESQTRVD